MRHDFYRPEVDHGKNEHKQENNADSFKSDVAVFDKILRPISPTPRP